MHEMNQLARMHEWMDDDNARLSPKTLAPLLSCSQTSQEAKSAQNQEDDKLT